MAKNVMLAWGSGSSNNQTLISIPNTFALGFGLPLQLGTSLLNFSYGELHRSSQATISLSDGNYLNQIKSPGVEGGQRVAPGPVAHGGAPVRSAL